MELGYHQPIMVNEVMDLLNVSRGGVYVDGTLGGGSHSEAILKRLPKGGHLYGIDRDREAIEAAGNRLAPFAEAFTPIHGNFFCMKSLLMQRGVAGVDGILLDLGVSSHQLDDGSRGFSYSKEAPLDMRMDQSAPLSAYEVVNTYSAEALIRIFRDYGEERFAPLIARRIVERRSTQPIATTTELADLIAGAIPAKMRHKEQQHPARRCFQAIRIEVNGELKGLEEAVENAISLLNDGGRLVILTFHSLEDRIVKNAFKRAENPCTCPPKSPQCVCGKTPYGRVLTRHPLVASEQEQRQNSRSTCCKLRALEKGTAGIDGPKTTYNKRRGTEYGRVL